MKPPSLWWCLLGLPFFAAGFGGFVYFLIDGIHNLTGAFTQAVVPGVHEFAFQPGNYTVFLEEHATVNGKVYETVESIEGLECRVMSKQGVEVPMRAASVDFNYSIGSRSGRSVLEFPVVRAGMYTFACDYGSATGPAVVVAIGSRIGEAFGGMMLRVLASAFGGAILGVAVVVGVIAARERAKRRIYSSGA